VTKKGTVRPAEYVRSGMRVNVPHHYYDFVDEDGGSGYCKADGSNGSIQHR